MDIVIEPWKSLVIHEIIEYKFEDWIKQISFNSRSSGGGIPTMQWSNGVVMAPINFPNTNAVVQEELRGILHWSSVSFALKKKFEYQVVQNNATINLVDVTNNKILRLVALKLKGLSKYDANST